MIVEHLSVYISGALVYSALEVLWRGFTHWTMALTGGVCAIMLYMVFNINRMSFLKKLVLGTVVITTVEFIVGIIVNLGLGWHVWDYSSQKYHVLGQICPKFVLYWFLLNIPVFLFCKGIRIIFTRLERQ